MIGAKSVQGSLGVPEHSFTLLGCAEIGSGARVARWPDEPMAKRINQEGMERAIKESRPRMSQSIGLCRLCLLNAAQRENT
jgi:hypothetical protein